MAAGGRPTVRLVAHRDASFRVPDSVLARLTSVFRMALDDDGSLYVADGGLPAVVHLDAHGTLRRLIGRSGAGPGEFNYVYRVGTCRDSVWALDPGQIRISVFPRTGRGVATIPFSMRAQPAAGSTRPRSLRGMPLALQPDGTLLVFDNVQVSGNPADGLREIQLLRTDRTLGVLDTIARLPAGHSTLNFVYDGGELHMGQPFGDDPFFDASSDGRALVVVDRAVARRAERGELTIRVWRGSTPPLVWRIPYQPRPLTAHEVDSTVQLLGTRPPEAPPSPVTPDSLRRRLYRPAFHPPVRWFTVARDGSLWLQVRFADSPDGVGDWLHLSPTGELVGRLTLPSTFRMLEANLDELYGTEGDPDDVPALVRYRVMETAR
jgi:hypothetical protein